MWNYIIFVDQNYYLYWYLVPSRNKCTVLLISQSDMAIIHLDEDDFIGRHDAALINVSH